MTDTELELLSINTIRMLSADGVEQAKSGHPGLPMGAAAFAYTLWTKHLRFNPKNPEWINRDRFVLSAGHGSMLLYSLLHLTGYDLPLDELKRFRQWDSKTPGHPEHRHTAGVETTTGPLGAGFSNGVGMAMAERILADHYNQISNEIIDYYTYAIVSDGDLMEGISGEAASIAGGLKLGKLIYLYDSNKITIEGSTDIAFCDDTALRFTGYGWQTIMVDDGNDTAAVDAALTAAKTDPRPSLIILRTHIAFGSPNKHDTAGAHGSPLGPEELKATKEALGWPLKPMFYVPKEVAASMGKAVATGAKLESAWNNQFEKYKAAYPILAQELVDLTTGKRSDDWKAVLPVFKAGDDALATREASGQIMNAIAPKIPLFLGGSADLGPSNNSHLIDYGDISGQGWDHEARNLHFGVREHAMAGILNGIALSNAITVYGATFLVFSDYMRGAMRLAAIMKLPVVYVLTHDSIGQGEDGATHQPIEHLASLRAMPNLTVIRPSDATETVAAWQHALEHRDGPTALILSRQKLPILDRAKLAEASNLESGGYVLNDVKTPDIVLLASGSEVPLVLQAAEVLAAQGKHAHVVSMPCTELFDQQSPDYQSSVLPAGVPRLAVEAASSYGWSKYLETGDNMISIDQFGASAPGGVMMEKFGFTVENVVQQALKLIKK